MPSKKTMQARAALAMKGHGPVSHRVARKLGLSCAADPGVSKKRAVQKSPANPQPTVRVVTETVTLTFSTAKYPPSPYTKILIHDPAPEGLGPQGKRRWYLYVRQPFCFWCYQPLYFDETTIDHLVSRTHGGTNDVDNLRIACGPCNWFRDHSFDRTEILVRRRRMTMRNSFLGSWRCR